MIKKPRHAGLFVGQNLFFGSAVLILRLGGFCRMIGAIEDNGSMALTRSRWWVFVFSLLSFPTVVLAQVETSGAYRAGTWFGRIFLLVLVILVIRRIMQRANK